MSDGFDPKKRAMCERIVDLALAELSDRIHALVDPESSRIRRGRFGGAPTPELMTKDEIMLWEVLREKASPKVEALDRYLPGVQLSREEYRRWAEWLESNWAEVLRACDGEGIKGTLRRHKKCGGKGPPLLQTVQDAWERIHGAGFEHGLWAVLEGADEALSKTDDDSEAAA